MGFIDHTAIENSGASPDGLIGSDGLIEIKCPNTATHIEYLLANEVPAEYIPQMKWQLACTKRTWCDFVSYDPRLNASNRLFIIRYTPTPQEITAIENEVAEFVTEVDELVKRLIST